MNVNREHSSPMVATAAAVPRLDARAVFGAAREVIILHRGQEYRLRITRAGKLILTK